MKESWGARMLVKKRQLRLELKSASTFDWWSVHNIHITKAVATVAEPNSYKVHEFSFSSFCLKSETISWRRAHKRVFGGTSILGRWRPKDKSNTKRAHGGWKSKQGNIWCRKIECSFVIIIQLRIKVVHSPYLDRLTRILQKWFGVPRWFSSFSRQYGASYSVIGKPLLRFN